MLETLLAIVGAPAVVLTTFFSAEILAGLQPIGGDRSTVKPLTPSAVVIIPAHNEEGSIGATVAALRAEVTGAAQLLIIADNCTDRTAELARANGAQVAVRTAPEARGKGHALAFARDQLANEPPSVVLVVDADCRIDRDSIVALIGAASREDRPVQAINLLRPDLEASPFVQMSNFAFMLRNLVRQRGLQRLAGRVHLTGTGMALPWKLFAEADLGGGSIVEDLNLGISLAARGHSPLLVEGATVWSPAASSENTLQQRERWEGGFLSSALPSGVRGLGRSIVRADLRGFFAAIDQCIPPLSLLGLLNLIVLLLLGVGAILGGGVYPLIALLIVCALAGAAVALAWLREGQRFASFGAIVRIPLYVIRKLPMYARLLIRGAPQQWLRTDRTP